MAKTKFFYTQNIKKGIIKLHKLLNEYEEKLLNVKTIDDINELLDEYTDKLNQAYKKGTKDIINLPYDEACDEYLIALGNEIDEACLSYTNFDENENNNSIYKYAYCIVGLIDVREKRISYMDALFSFLNNYKIQIEKDEIYKDIDFRNSKIIKFLELSQEDALFTKNEIVATVLLHEKFNDADLLLKTTLLTKPEDFLNKEIILKMVDEIITKYEKCGLVFSDAYKNIDFEMNLNHKNYYIYRISFIDPYLKNLETYIGDYEDFVFVKSKINQHIYLLYVVSSKITGGKTVIYQNPIKGNLFAVNFEIGDKLLGKFSFLNKLNIKNEDSVYKLEDDCKPKKDKFYTTMEYVEKYITAPLFNKKTSRDTIENSLLFLGAFKSGNMIYSQILENVRKGQYNSTVFTDINENIHDLIEFMFVNEEFASIFDKYSHELDPVYFSDRMLEALYAYEDILLDKYKKDPNYLKENKLPLPYCFLFFKDSLHMLLKALEKQRRSISKRFLNNLYITLRKDKKLYEKVLSLNDSFRVLDFDDLDIEEFSEDPFDDFDDEDDGPIYKA